MLEFFRVYIGESSMFFKQLLIVSDNSIRLTDAQITFSVNRILYGYIDYLKNDLEVKITVERKIQLETISDLLEQATNLLNDKSYHPASACVLIGGALEEFLRTWVETEKLSTTVNKSTIDTYAKLLREKELIKKQDYKDITSWAGLRNNAAHGVWEEVNDRNKIEIMLTGVNLFIRQYS
jgi:hypothetical protein